MRRAVWLSIMVLAGVLSAAGGRAAAEAQDWSVVKGRHFLVHHRADAAFAESVVGKAEEYYGRIRAELGFAKFDDFWLWENRVKIFVYSSRDDFARATGAPGWAMGRAVSAKREISTYLGDGSFMDSVLPHELTHLVMDDFMGGGAAAVPLWLKEGVAQWEEPAKRRQLVRTARMLVARNAVIPLSSLSAVSVRDLLEKGNALEFYAQSASLVGYLVEMQGAERFRTFCGELRDGKSMDAALRFAYPEPIRNIAGLEVAWKKHLVEQQEAGQ